jgi:hypothetical protein
MLKPIEEAVERAEAVKERKQNLLALVRAGHVQPKGMSRDDTIRVLLADIRECDEFIERAMAEDARAELECRSRFFT